MSQIIESMSRDPTIRQDVDANKDPVEQVAIERNNSNCYKLLQCLSFSMNSFFLVMMEATSISYISRKVDLDSFATDTSVFLVRVHISFVDLEMPLTTLCACVYTHVIHTEQFIDKCCLCLSLSVFSMDVKSCSV